MTATLSASDFFADLLKHVKGEWADKPFVLQAWQQQAIDTIFGTLKPDGTRRYDTVYIEVPRKNGKSTLAAGIALYLLFADQEEGAEVYSLAADREQARLVFDTAKQMVVRSKTLSNLCDLYKDSIVVPRSASRYKVMSSEAYSAWGVNASGIIFDELHAQPNRDLWDAMRTSTGARRQPLTVAITTAGYDRQSICWEVHQHALKVAENPDLDPAFLPIVFAADEEDDWGDPAVWAKANPCLGVTLKAEYLEREYARAKDNTQYENTFRRLHLNQWTEQAVRWLPMDQWDSCNEPFRLSDMEGLPCYGGLDLASTRDVTALSLVFADGDLFYVVPYFWVPSAGAHLRERRDRVPYRAWEKRGLVELTPGDTTDYSVIRDRINELNGRFEIQEIAYDPYNATQLVCQLDADGFQMVKFSQGWQRMSPACKDFEKILAEGKLRHGGNEVLRWMASNVDIQQDRQQNIKPVKPDRKDAKKIDGIVATVMALARALESDDQSAYDTADLMVLDY